MINFSNRDILLSSRGFKITTIKPFFMWRCHQNSHNLYCNNIACSCSLMPELQWSSKCVSGMNASNYASSRCVAGTFSFSCKQVQDWVAATAHSPTSGRKKQPLLPWAMLSMLSQLQKEEKHWKESKCLFFLKSFNCKLNSELICWYI